MQVKVCCLSNAILAIVFVAASQGADCSCGVINLTDPMTLRVARVECRAIPPYYQIV